MKCACVFCAYQEDGKCTLDEIQIDWLGSCKMHEYAPMVLDGDNVKPHKNTEQKEKDENLKK